MALETFKSLLKSNELVARELVVFKAVIKYEGIHAKDTYEKISFSVWYVYELNVLIDPVGLTRSASKRRNIARPETGALRQWSLFHSFVFH
jgi:hypothetical protein